MIEVAIGLQLLLQPYPHVLPPIWFLFVRPEVCLELPPDSISLWTPLLSAMYLPLLGRTRDLHPLESAHAGRTKKHLSRREVFHQLKMTIKPPSWSFSTIWLDNTCPTALKTTLCR